jgi:hypothetical protein
MEKTGLSREPNVPSPEAVAELFAQARPELEALFRRHWVSEDEAEMLLDEALTLLLLRWDRIADPRQWLRGTLDKAIRSRLLIPQFANFH